jgi:hypothetical protein
MACLLNLEFLSLADRLHRALKASPAVPQSDTDRQWGSPSCTRNQKPKAPTFLATGLNGRLDTFECTGNRRSLVAYCNSYNGMAGKILRTKDGPDDSGDTRLRPTPQKFAVDENKNNNNKEQSRAMIKVALDSQPWLFSGAPHGFRPRSSSICPFI